MVEVWIKVYESGNSMGVELVKSDGSRIEFVTSKHAVMKMWGDGRPVKLKLKVSKKELEEAKIARGL